MRRGFQALTAALIGALVLIASTGCGVRTQVHREISDAITEVATAPQGTVQELASVTDWEWDTVSIFTEGTLGEKVLAESGYEVGDGTLTSNERVIGATLLVFRNDGEVVKAINAGAESLWPTSYDLLTYDYPGYIEKTSLGATLVTAPGEGPPPTP